MSAEGIIASPGIAIGRAVIYRAEQPTLTELTVPEDLIDDEIARFLSGREMSQVQLEQLYRETYDRLGEGYASVFEVHKMLLEDKELEQKTIELIRSGMPAANAADAVIADNVAELMAQRQSYLHDRAADLRDVGVRLTCNILGIALPGPRKLEEDTIVVAHDLTPSDTACLDLDKVKGFITEVGGITAHSAILARTLEVPALVGCKDVLKTIQDKDQLILDAVHNELVTNPDHEKLEEARESLQKMKDQRLKTLEMRDMPAQTSDGQIFELFANIGQPRDVEWALDNGAHGIGLFRTEFLYMGRHALPSEQEQFQAYRSVAESMKGRPVTIRTLDIGGDKYLPYLDLPKEMNPFLGWRAIRYCLDHPEILRTQLRAILRASAFGKFKILFPMVVSLDEVQRLKTHLDEIRHALALEGVDFDHKCEIGVMIETPAAVMIADQLAEEVDFFSIGTNDLIQYILAVDRGNENIASLFDGLSPSVLRAVQMVIDAAHRAGIPVGMCGELAGNEQAALILAGMGLDEFSMTASSIARVKKTFMKANMPTLKQLAETCLNARSSDEVKKLIDAVISV